MTFDDIETQARVGDLVFFSGRRPFSWLIRWMSRSRWSHVGIIVYAADETTGIGAQVVESLEGKGVQLIRLAEWRRDHGEVSLGRVDLGTDIQRAAATRASKRRGCRYCSPWQFYRSFSWFWTWLHRLLGIKDDRDPQRYFCSELVAESFFYCGVCLPKSPACMYPGDVASLPFVTLSERVAVPS